MNNNDLAQIIQSNGWLLTFGLVYFWGLAMNLTPCVFPMIPITISYFGGTSGEGTSRSAGLIRAILFVIGMAITYSVLGVSAALTGKLFGASLGNIYVVSFVSAIMVFMALSMFGVFQMTASSSLLSKIQDVRDRLGFIGALFFGLVIGIVMAPCVGPFIISLLAFVAGKGEPVLGFWLFFTLAMGMGTPYIFLGYYTSALKSMPRPGTWMVWLERFFGFVLIGYAYNLWMPFIPSNTVALGVLAVYILFASAYLAFAGRSPGDKPAFRVIKSVICAAGVVLGLYVAYLAFHKEAPAVTVDPSGTKRPTAMAWQPYSDEALKKAQAEGKPVVIDFYAKWCAACKELDEYTWTDPKIIEVSQDFVCLKADFTSTPDVDENPTAKKFKIQGLPTVIFISKSGKELNDLRQAEFVKADKMLPLMEKAKTAP